MKDRQLKRGVIMLLTTVIFMMSIIPYLPVDILTAFAFSMQFNTSTSGDGHYADLQKYAGYSYGI